MARKSRKHISDIDAAISAETAFYNAAAYIRLSGDDTKKRGDSLDTQRNIIENHIAILPDITLTDVYVDSYRTGINFERPGFQRMLSDIESGRVNCIIVKDLTRFGRNAIDAGYYLEKYFPLKSVRFIAITDNYDTNEGDSGIIIPIKNIISESYSLDIGRKCRSVQLRNMNDGRFVGKLAPHGYVKALDDCRKLVIDDEAAVTIRYIFGSIYNGVSLQELRRSLNDNGFLTPSKHKYEKGLAKKDSFGGDGYWHMITIKSILKDRVYIGDMVQGKTRKINGKQIPVNPDEWICVPNTHEPIISREVFEHVQSVLEENRENHIDTRKKTKPYTTSALKGVVCCAHCGIKMHRHRNPWNGAYWFHCRSQEKKNKGACFPVAVREQDLLSEIMTFLQKQSEAINGRFLSLNCLNTKQALDSESSELRDINKHLDKDGRVLRSLYENMVNGLITADEFTWMKIDYENKIEMLKNRADTIRDARKEAERKTDTFRGMTEAVTSVINDGDLTAEIVNRLIEQIRVNTDKSFEIILRYNDEFKGVCS
jgi:DNA invertase Pin-like site-specific DNA recombinase